MLRWLSTKLLSALRSLPKYGPPNYDLPEAFRMPHYVWEPRDIARLIDGSILIADLEREQLNERFPALHSTITLDGVPAMVVHKYSDYSFEIDFHEDERPPRVMSLDLRPAQYQAEAVQKDDGRLPARADTHRM